MEKELVSRSEFARRCATAPSTVTKACLKALKAACVGKRVNVAHPAALAFAEKHSKATGGDPLLEKAEKLCNEKETFTINFIKVNMGVGSGRAKALLEAMKSRPETPNATGWTARNESKKRNITLPENIADFADMKLSDLVARFGTDAQFLDWLKATKTIEDIAEKRIKNAESEGRLVSRKLVKVGVVDEFEALHIRMLSDGAKTIARRVVALHEGGAQIRDLELFVSETISSFIAPAKAKIVRALRTA